MQDEFADLCLSGQFQQQVYNPEEQDEAQFSHLTRLSFAFNARDNGRLRELIDFINLPENGPRHQPRPTQRERETSKVN